MQENVDLGSRIKALRKHFDLNRSAFAARVGTSGTTIKNIEEGDTQSPAASLLARIAKEFGVNLNWLQYNEGDMLAGIPGSSTVSGNKIKGSGNALGINSQVSGVSPTELVIENEKLKLENEYLKQRLKDKEEMIELLKKK